MYRARGSVFLSLVTVHERNVVRKDDSDLAILVFSQGAVWAHLHSSSTLSHGPICHCETEGFAVPSLLPYVTLDTSSHLEPNLCLYLLYHSFPSSRSVLRIIKVSLMPGFEIPEPFEGWDSSGFFSAMSPRCEMMFGPLEDLALSPYPYQNLVSAHRL